MKADKPLVIGSVVTLLPESVKRYSRVREGEQFEVSWLGEVAGARMAKCVRLENRAAALRTFPADELVHAERVVACRRVRVSFWLAVNAGATDTEIVEAVEALVDDEMHLQKEHRTVQTVYFEDAGNFTATPIAPEDT